MKVNKNIKVINEKFIKDIIKEEFDNCINILDFFNLSNTMNSIKNILLSKQDDIKNDTFNIFYNKLENKVCKTVLDYDYDIISKNLAIKLQNPECQMSNEQFNNFINSLDPKTVYKSYITKLIILELQNIKTKLNNQYDLIMNCLE